MSADFDEGAASSAPTNGSAEGAASGAPVGGQTPGATRFTPHALLLAVLLVVAVWSAAIAYAIALPNQANDFNSPAFIVRHSWVKFAMLATQPFRHQLTRDEEDATVARFFEINKLVAQQERIAGDPASTPDAAAAARAADASLRSERDGIKNTVQLILEGRLTRAIKETGLTRHIGGDLVWPPVNIEFQDPPSVLVTSPRSEIRKESERLLQGDLPVARAQEIEAKAESDGQTSALVVEIGGIALYPAVIPPDEDYQFILQDIAHEWTHHYLYFTPLGRAYFASAKLTTLNETVANMVGRELGDRLFAEYPLAKPQASFVTIAQIPAAAPAPAPPAAAPIDFTTEMRNLRREVEGLLAQGKIDEAEQRMEQEREFLAANGYYIRKLNQAYFAFHGSYADSAGSIDPIGPKLDQLRKSSASLQQFMIAARALTSEDDLDRVLASR